MRFHPDPEPATSGSHLINKYGYDRQVAAWIKRLSDGEVLTDELTEEQLLFVCSEVEKRRIGSARESKHVERAIKDTAPLITAPDLDKPLDDIELLFALPEMREWWADVERLRASDMGEQGGGFKANYAGTLAVMARMAIAGVSTHVDDNLEGLARDSRLREFFGWVNASAMTGVLNPARVAALPDAVTPPSAGRFSELSERLAKPIILACKHANMAMMRELEVLLHEEGRLDRKKSVLDDVMTDGTDCPAWAVQKGGGGAGSPRDMRYRQHIPEAGFRAYARTSGRGGGGKVDINGESNLSGSRLVRNVFKAWRGYYMNVLASVRLQLPVQATGFDAAINEPDGLVPLLSDAYNFAADIGWDFTIKRLTADSAYDTDPTVRLCEVHYGIDPVFVRDTSKDKNAPFDFGRGASQNDTLKGFTKEGQLICNAHENTLAYDSVVKPPRMKDGKKMRPGQPTNEDQFRIRGLADCDKSKLLNCGRPSIRMKEEWRRLTAIPHHAVGRPDLHALRTALEARLNGVEMIHARLKGGHKLALAGPARTRIRNKDVVEALIQIALLSMTAAALVDRRLRLGLALDPAGIPSSIKLPNVPAQLAAPAHQLPLAA